MSIFAALYMLPYLCLSNFPILATPLRSDHLFHAHTLQTTTVWLIKPKLKHKDTRINDKTICKRKTGQRKKFMQAH